MGEWFPENVRLSDKRRRVAGRSGGIEVDDDGMCSHGRPTRLVVSEYTEIQICQSADVRGRQMPGGGGVVGLTDII